MTPPFALPHGTQFAIVMGVSGCGKTTVGEALARALGWAFIDADTHHPAANVQKMRDGIALSDADRQPWLEALNRLLLDAQLAKRPTVLGCSSLKAKYRATLRQGLHHLHFVWLDGDHAVLAQRLAERQHRYMPASLLDSQLATLEPPSALEAVRVPLSLPVDEMVAGLTAHMR